jgi:aminoglycoside/choline kinase family phosphotransferase
MDMRETEKRDKLIKIFEDWAKENAINIYPLPPSGSDREYFRIISNNKTSIGVYNPDKKENIAFINFSKHFLSNGLNVPDIYREDIDNNIYLVRDLGNITLFSLLTSLRENGNFPEEIINYYKQVLEQLPQFQIIAGKDLDYSVCYPRSRFDKQSMMWDLNYFKYYFLKLAKIQFDEQDLEEDFQKLTKFLLQAGCEYFLYRDFQSRNIMIFNDEPYFIDYQGGRKGALQYDLASLLYDAKADIPFKIRDELLEYYVDVLSNYKNINRREFLQYYYGYVLIRIMQAMGSYGFRGFYEKKEHFLQSIPYALNNLSYVLNNANLPINIPTLYTLLERIADSQRLRNLVSSKKTLKIHINSFSYKRGIPIDESGHGGGFVFDCRALPNPSKYKKYENFTGKDKEVIEFLDKDKNVQNFLKDIFSLVDRSIESYYKKNYTHLMINFGCTGGQHRSVYCALMLSKYLKENHNVEVSTRHLELKQT